jgi:hypothetical protein
MTTSSTELPFLWPEGAWPADDHVPPLTGLSLRCMSCDDAGVVSNIEDANDFLSQHEVCL